MNKSWFYLGAIGSLAIVLTSCGDGKPAATPSPSAATPATAPTAAVPATPAPTAATPIFPTPVAAGSPIVPGKAISVNNAGLIPATNGDNWAKTVNKGNADPFATLALQPVEAVEKDPITGLPVRATSTAKIASNTSAIKSGVNKPLPSIKVAANPTQVSKASGKSKIASKGSTSADTGITQDINPSTSAIPRTGINKALPKITVASNPTKVSSIAGTKIASRGGFKAGVAEDGYTAPGTGYLRGSKLPISAIPRTGINKALPKMVIALRPSGAAKVDSSNQIAARSEQVADKQLQATALEISGVIEIEGKTQIIVKLPGESFSRYIDVGDRVANNILVKRIESQDTLSPIVVLEEAGVEIPRRVGDKVLSGTPTSKP